MASLHKIADLLSLQLFGCSDAERSGDDCQKGQIRICNSLDDIPYDRIVEYKSGLDVSSNVARQKLNGWMVPRNLVATAVNKAVLDPVNKTLHPFDVLFREDDEDYGTNVVIGFLSSCTDGKRGLGNAKAHASLVRDVCKKYYGFNVKTVVFRFTNKK